MSMPVALETICVGICCATLQPISAREPNIWDTQISNSKGRKARKRTPFQVRICCKRSQHLQCYADQPIPWSNCSWADRADHEVTDTAPADEMAVNAEGASRDLRVSPALENSRIWPDGRTVGERAPRRRIVAA